ncbi:MAG: beta-glucuronidase [Candidatus Acidiferrum sp.]
MSFQVRPVPRPRMLPGSLVLLVAALTWLAPIRARAQAGPSEIPASAAQPTLLVDVERRTHTSLNGDWHVIVDAYGAGLTDAHRHPRKDGYFMNAPQTDDSRPIEYSFSKSATLRVPGDWNTQRESLFYYEGLVWYEKDFSYTPVKNKRVFLHVGAANYRATLWVNTQKICEHEGGFTPFDCEVTAALHDGSNFAVIAVDNTRIDTGVPTVRTDWWNYGGLTRDVSLVEVPEQFVDDYDLHLNRQEHSTVNAWVHVENAPAGTSVKLTIPEAKIAATQSTDATGKATFTLHASNLQLWSPEHPKLYGVQIQAGADTLDDDIGFRTIETRGTQLLLNGQPIFLRGVCIHAEAPYRTGRAYSQQDVDALLGWVHELGGNFMRLAHYPHDERMTRTADRLGILVWSEVPVYWAEAFGNSEVLQKAQQQLREMIRRDRDKASVILWSVANETPNTPERTHFLKTLAANVHEWDPSRLVTAALLVRAEGETKIVDDPLGEALDVIGTNEYIGWYEKKPETADQTTWKIAYQKPLIMSEFGGEAKAGLRGAPTERWTEDYQANIYRHQLPMLNRIPQLRGMTPWILMDFRSPSRLLPGLQDNYNRKGLISEQGQRKQAFYVLQEAYKNHTVGKPD